MNRTPTPAQALRLRQLREQIAARKAAPAPRFVPKPPRYDQVYFDGLAWLGSLP